MNYNKQINKLTKQVNKLTNKVINSNKPSEIDLLDRKIQILKDIAYLYIELKQ